MVALDTPKVPWAALISYFFEKSTTFSLNWASSLFENFEALINLSMVVLYRGTASSSISHYLLSIGIAVSYVS